MKNHNLEAIQKKCWVCGKKLTGRSNKRYCGKTCKKRSIKQRNAIFILNYKKERKCPKCGFDKHTEVLQFHHKNKNKEKKGREINQLIRECASINNLKKEIKKCILLCPNCHMWLHFQESKIHSLVRETKGMGGFLRSLNRPTPSIIKNREVKNGIQI